MFPQSFDYQQLLNRKIESEIKNIQLSSISEVSKNQNIIADTALKGAQTANTQGQTSLQPLQAKQIVENIRNIAVNTQNTSERIRLIAQELVESQARVRGINQQISFSEAQQLAQEFDNNMKRQGINPNSSNYLDALARWSISFLTQAAATYKVLSTQLTGKK